MINDNFAQRQIKEYSAVEYSVYEISNKIKILLEENLNSVRIKGEISGLKIAPSGHVYFNLKDNFAVLACICWRGVFSKLKFKLADGLEVIVLGKITAYAGQSKYQLSVESMDPAGLGAMMQILAERKARLEKEGLFNAERKKSIPFMPQKIGVITSITGAVIQDILHRIKERCPSNVIIWPSLVQGELAAAQIADGIQCFNNLPSNQKPNVIILARGGGSIEDLWCFNEETVVRAIAASEIPIISAIGHETDFTLSDYAADLRAPTPTAAAEFVSPRIADLRYNLNLLHNKFTGKFAEKLKIYDQLLNNYSKSIKYGLNYFDSVLQKLDELSLKLSESLPHLLKFKALSLARFSNSFNNPHKILKENFLKLNYGFEYLKNSFNNFLLKKQNNLNLNASLLLSLDYNNVLKRGYAIIETLEGKYLTSAQDVHNNQKLNIKFRDGKISVSKN